MLATIIAMIIKIVVMILVLAKNLAIALIKAIITAVKRTIAATPEYVAQAKEGADNADLPEPVTSIMEWIRTKTEQLNEWVNPTPKERPALGMEDRAA